MTTVSEKLNIAQRLKRAARTVMMIDVVEFVRLIELDEEGVISRWLDFIEHIEKKLLPDYGGHLINTNTAGDSLLLEFSDVRSAVSAAIAIQSANHQCGMEQPRDRQILLRVGVEVSDVIVDGDHVYGRGVTIAARLMTLAGPGEIIISAKVREQLTSELDADIEDLGECFLRHVRQPVRAFRIGAPGPHPVIGSAETYGELLPSLAIIPFTASDAEGDHQVLGEVLAEEMIREVSRSPNLNVISRLSTTAFCGRRVVLTEIGAHLKADYVLWGVYRINEKRLTLDVELAEAKSGRVVWTECLKDRIDEVLLGQQELIRRAVSHIDAAVMLSEVRRAQSQPLPTVKSYTLLIGAIALMHRLSLRDFEEAHHLLRTLIDRATRQAIPQAWLAKWHVLRVQQGWSDNPRQDTYLALECTKRALDTDPYSSLALAIDGFVHTNLLKQLDVARERYDLAIESNPNEPLAWLLRGTLHAFVGNGRQAVDDTQRALRLSPLDPHRYFYDSLAATAHLAAREYERAMELAKRSLRANRTHTSTLRALTIAQWQLGYEEEARKTAQELLTLEPTLTIGDYLKRSPSAPYSTGKEWSNALQQAGVPIGH